MLSLYTVEHPEPICKTYICSIHFHNESIVYVKCMHEMSVDLFDGHVSSQLYSCSIYYL